GEGEGEGEFLCQWWQAGVVGYLPRQAPQQVWQQCLEVVRDGGSYFPQTVLGRLQDVAQQQMAVSLTDREQELLTYLTQGLSNKEIAIRLDVSHHTVRNNLCQLYGKLGVATREEAAGWTG
ncbi:hypothetical protein MNBD_CHLOROFLEXI01-2723, partial [hydrothermal vent metagenome]